MPDKKLLPLSLMPLEIEFALNPYALIAEYVGKLSGTETELMGGSKDWFHSRDYSITKFEMFAHVLFFE